MFPRPGGLRLEGYPDRRSPSHPARADPPTVSVAAHGPHRRRGVIC